MPVETGLATAAARNFNTAPSELKPASQLANLTPRTRLGQAYGWQVITVGDGDQEGTSASNLGLQRVYGSRLRRLYRAVRKWVFPTIRVPSSGPY